LAETYFGKLAEFLPDPANRGLPWTENVQIALALFFHEEAVKTGSFNKYTLEHALKILPHIRFDEINDGEEKDRLPRRHLLRRLPCSKRYSCWSRSKS
jgi:hypothetical protein